MGRNALQELPLEFSLHPDMEPHQLERSWKEEEEGSTNEMAFESANKQGDSLFFPLRQRKTADGLDG